MLFTIAFLFSSAIAYSQPAFPDGANWSALPDQVVGAFIDLNSISTDLHNPNYVTATLFMNIPVDGRYPAHSLWLSETIDCKNKKLRVDAFRKYSMPNAMGEASATVSMLEFGDFNDSSKSAKYLFNLLCKK